MYLRKSVVKGSPFVPGADAQAGVSGRMGVVG